MNKVKIILWKGSRFYELINFDTGHVISKERYKEGEELNGVYRFIKNTKVACFRFQDTYWLRYGEFLINLSDKSVSVKCTTKWPFLKTDVFYNNKLLFSFKDFAPIRLFNSRIDFTYDSFDFSLDYFGGRIRAEYLICQNK